tara:strand:+ start:9398 stop:11050 length:1653 start_codon:yes stop_codon:yes gene_type:complete
MLSKEALTQILGITDSIQLNPKKMAEKLTVTFYPSNKAVLNENITSFARNLERVLKELGVTVVPYAEAKNLIPLSKILSRFIRIMMSNFLYIVEKLLLKDTGRIYIHGAVLKNLVRRNRIKTGISIIALGEGVQNDLPMDHTASFTKSQVVSIVEKPAHIQSTTSFHEHFDTAMSLFAHHMSNIILAVDDTTWTLYNFNASHPTYKRHVGVEEFKRELLESLISKLAAPMQPQRLADFKFLRTRFDAATEPYASLTADMLKSGVVLEKLGLYPAGKKIDDLPFRNNFYRWIGKIHLDNRNGMSYGFLAWQLPTKLSELHSVDLLESKYREEIVDKDYFYDNSNNLNIVIYLPEFGTFFMKVPEVTVLSQRSGCDKTNFTPEKDLLKMGIHNGKMFMEAPKGARVASDYKPSFDTKVILAHAAGNAIVASILAHINPDAAFARQVKDTGVALSHWHGYLRPEDIPTGWYVHGFNNPHVACSTPHSALFAIDGKMKSFLRSLEPNAPDFLGDVHIEPQHGTNINFTSLSHFADFLEAHPRNATVGNIHLSQY